MSQPSLPQRITVGCPHCGKTFVTAAAHAGRQARCSGCSQVFVIAPVPAAAIFTVAAPAGASSSAPPPVPAESVRMPAARGPVCSICQCPVGPQEPAAACPDCRAVFHRECWDYNGGCAAYGCASCPPTQKINDLEIPPSYWGREEKPCPKCGSMIAAAAVRCRHCGATFSSATPQDARSYTAEQNVESRLPAVRTASVWLLVFSLVPCTAPPAAVVGLVWYWSNRKAIGALPPVRAAVCKIAVGVAVAQTALLALFGFLAHLLSGS